MSDLEKDYQKLALYTHKFKNKMVMYVELMNDDELMLDCYDNIIEVLNDIDKDIESFKACYEILKQSINKKEEEAEKTENELVKSTTKTKKIKVSKRCVIKDDDED